MTRDNEYLKLFAALYRVLSVGDVNVSTYNPVWLGGA